MFCNIADFIGSWDESSKGTLKMFDHITDDALLYKRLPNYGRSVGNLAWHITACIPQMMNMTGLKIDMLKDEDSPSTIAEIKENYKKISQQLMDQVKGWSDADLQKEDNMYGETWKRGLTLFILMSHEIHHRAQMTVLMRQLGFKVPGLMGPSKEEWQIMNHPAPSEREA